MEREEYLNIIINEIKKNEELLKDTNKSISFYEKMNDEEKVNELAKNKKLYETRIKYLKGIENLPLYQSINNMNDEELDFYKEKLINNNIKELELIEEKIKEIEQDMVDSNTEIDNIYVLFKKTNDETYIDRAKEILNHIKDLKKQIDTLSKEKEIIEDKINLIFKLNDNNLKERLLNEAEISASNIEEALLMYTPDKIDKLVVPMCKDLKILDNIIDKMREYNNFKEVYQQLSVPRILNDYTYDIVEKNFIDCLKSELYDTELNDNILKIYDEEDFDILKDNIELGLVEVTGYKEELSKYKELISLFPKNISDYNLNDLKKLNELILNSNNSVNELIEKIEKYNNEYMKLYNKHFQSKGILEKANTLNLMANELVKEVLDILWKGITSKIINCINNIDHNKKFYFGLDICDVEKEKNNSSIIIERDNYSTLNLFNIKVLIEEILEKYERITDSLNGLKNDTEERKIEFIKAQEKKSNELKNIEANINKLYKTVSNQELNIEDYDKIINVFKNNTIIDSIVKVEREDLINKVNKYSLINENIIDELTINEEGKQEDKVNEESIVKENNINTEDKINKKDKISKETLNKIKDTINKLGLSNEQIREIIDKIIKDDLLIDNILKLDKKGTLNKEQIKNVIKDIKIDENTNFTILISELYEKLDLDEDTIKELGNEILKDRSLIIDVLKSNKKILFNLLKNDVMKKILKK